MSQSYYTKLKIPKSFFPTKDGDTMTLSRGKRTVTRNDGGEPHPDSLALKDENGLYLWIYFQGDYVLFFDRTYGNWGAEWMVHAIKAAWKAECKKTSTAK